MIKNTVIPLLILLSFAFGAYFYVDDWKADAGDLQILKDDYQAYKLEQRYERIQERIWTLEDRYDGRRMPDSVKEEYRDLQMELQSIGKKLEIYYKGDS